MADFLPRFATAVVGIPMLVALGLVAPNWSIWLFYATAASIGAWEYIAMGLGKRPDGAGLLGVFGTFAVLSAAYWSGPTNAYLAAALTVVAVMIAVTFTTEDVRTAAPRVGTVLAGWAYATLLFGGLLLLVVPEDGQRHAVAPHQAGWLLLPMFVIWAGDTGAYFAGRAFGRHKLAPRLSPKKTWEGAVGGACASVLGGWAAASLFFDGIPFWQVVVIALPAAVLGQVGDLSESLIKRSTGVKDSGRIIYGHGGVLDRVDGLIFAAPYFAIARHLLRL